MKQIHELRREGHSTRWIARKLGISRNTVKKYLNAPELPRATPRQRPSKLDNFKAYLWERITKDGVTNGPVLLREIRSRGYDGGKSILADFLKQHRPEQRQPAATVRYETQPGEQAQVDFKELTYRKTDGTVVKLWGFVMVLGWSRAIYVEFIPKADLPTFIRCHLNAFRHFGGVPSRVLYDNTKLVVLGRDEENKPIWTQGFLDFSLRVGFTVKLCRPYRPQTKGKVERSIQYVAGNFLAAVKPTDLADLNRQAVSWCKEVADQRIHGTTFERPALRLEKERDHLCPLPPPDRLLVFDHDVRKVGRDGYVQWAGCFYRVSTEHSLTHVEIRPHNDRVEVWRGAVRLEVHAIGSRGQRHERPQRRAACQVREVDATVQKRPLSVYVREAR